MSSSFAVPPSSASRMWSQNGSGSAGASLLMCSRRRQPSLERFASSLDQAVRVQHERRTFLDRHLSDTKSVGGPEWRVVRCVEKACRAFGGAKQRGHVTRRRVCPSVLMWIEHPVQDGDERVILEHSDHLVESVEHDVGPWIDQRQCAATEARCGHVGDCFEAVSRHVADGDTHAATGQCDRGVPIAADRCRCLGGAISRRERHSGHVRQRRR